MDLAYRFRDLVFYYHGRKHGGLEAYMMMLEKKPRVLHLDWKEGSASHWT